MSEYSLVIALITKLDEFLALTCAKDFRRYPVVFKTTTSAS
jgi:hypothetical protein